MRKFEKPCMMVVNLTGENIITSSTTCYGVTCRIYECNECVSCDGVHKCLSVTCNVYDA